jgi:anti-anti-sigma regulatory factor
VLRPASLLTGAFGHDDGTSGWPEPMTVRRPRRDVLEVGGAVVHTAADRMAVELRRAVNHSPVPVQVDLTDVSLLSSGGVQVLFEALDDALPKTGQLVICAAPGSLAQHVLELAQLPYEPRRPSSE